MLFQHSGGAPAGSPEGSSRQVAVVNQDGADAAVVVLAVGHRELGENVLDVAGDGPVR
jgi:hypothetical protein